MPEHSILCPAFQTPMATLFGSSGPCDCGAESSQSVATAVAEPPITEAPVETASPPPGDMSEVKSADGGATIVRGDSPDDSGGPLMLGSPPTGDGAGGEIAIKPPVATDDGHQAKTTTDAPASAPAQAAEGPASETNAAASVSADKAGPAPDTASEKPKKTRGKRQKKTESEAPKAGAAPEPPLEQPSPAAVAAVRAAVDLPQGDKSREILTAGVTAEVAEIKKEAQQANAAATRSVECLEAKVKADYFATASQTTSPAPEAQPQGSPAVASPPAAAVKVAASSSTPGKKRRLFAGIDSGILGYTAVIDETGDVIEIMATPSTGGKKPVYDEAGMVRIALRLKELGVEEILLERQQPINKINRGGKSVNITAKANFKKGLGYGLWRGILTALGLRFDTVAPITWKRAMQIAGGAPEEVKKRAIDKSQSLFPGVDLRDTERKPKARVPSGDKAESLLLARYVMLTKIGGLTAVRDAEEYDEDDDEDDDLSDGTDDQVGTTEGAQTGAQVQAQETQVAAPSRAQGAQMEAQTEAQVKTTDAPPAAAEAPVQSTAETPAPAPPAAEVESPPDAQTEPPKTEETKADEATGDEPAPTAPDGEGGEQAWLERMSAFMKSGQTIPGAPRKNLKNAKPVPAPPAKKAAKSKAAKKPSKPKPAAKPKTSKRAAAKPAVKSKKAAKRPSGPKKAMTPAERAAARVLRGL